MHITCINNDKPVWNLTTAMNLMSFNVSKKSYRIAISNRVSLTDSDWISLRNQIDIYCSAFLPSKFPLERTLDCWKTPNITEVIGFKSFRD